MKGITGLFILSLAHIASCSLLYVHRPSGQYRRFRFDPGSSYERVYSLPNFGAIRKTATASPKTTTEFLKTTTESPKPTTESPPHKGEELTLAPYIDRIDKLEEKVERLTRFIESQEKENSRDKQNQRITDTKLQQLEAHTLELSTTRVELESTVDEKWRPLELEMEDLRQGVVKLSRRLSDLNAMFEDQSGEISKIRQDVQDIREAEKTCTSTTLTLKKNMFQALAKLRRASSETTQDVAALTDHIHTVQERVDIIGNRTVDVGEGEGTLDNYVGGITISENDDGENVVIPEIFTPVETIPDLRLGDDTDMSGPSRDDENSEGDELPYDSNMYTSP